MSSIQNMHHKNDDTTSNYLYIIIPAYNEEENIECCVNDWYQIIELLNSNDIEKRSRLVIINDGSKDKTYEILEKLSITLPYLIPLTKENGGHGSSVLYGYRYAIANGADWIFQTDSDGQTDPSEFDKFWNARKEFDVIIGNRVSRGDGSSRAIIQRVYCWMLRLIFGIKVEDANAPYRLMKKELVQNYIERLPMDFNIPNIMFTTYFAYYKDKLLFVPISFKPREKGENTINYKKIIKIGWRAFGDFIRLRKEMH